ncbi:hypothetical protein Rleg9DRAFT_3673 [Rhizobium leguminosarum bv. trifolii WSM597]|uniref:Uncharacterized protein n=1 Tax=Rhizobium leguminosarum bv. trifolii WSM597 TaxID=754764 RepID=I9NA97_RHILT|nr:hypothetical protein [Rhizobium leguminosarum]EJB04814.1 hypothetical protein Rleg9DRAFT_3673 [Rhizobium leguminosarum bv. trifolii WSM597]
MEEIELYLAVGEAEKASKYDGHRRCSFVVFVKKDEELRAFGGLARVKDTTSLFAMAISTALGGCLPTDFEAGPWPRVTIIAKSPDFWERIDQASIREAQKPKKMADQRKAWKDTATLRALFQIAPARAPGTNDEERLLAKATALQAAHAKKALSEVPIDFSGLWEDRELDLGVVVEHS